MTGQSLFMTALFVATVAYLIGAAVLFLVGVRSGLRMANRHAEDDSNGKTKVVVATVAGLLIAAGGVFVLQGFSERAEDGMYDSLDARLKDAVGEKGYQDHVSTIATKDIQIPIVQENLDAAPAKLAAARANATAKPGDAALAEAVAKEEKAWVALNETMAAVQKERSDAMKAIDDGTSTHGPFILNHQFYDSAIAPAVSAQDDQAIRDAVRSTTVVQKDMVLNADKALAIKDKAVQDLQNALVWMLYPSLIGASFAPLVWAQGSILRRAFVPSDTVGYKQYPGNSGAWFLLFGAFGVPALPFAAWTLHDMKKRSAEGQIAL